MNLSLARTGAGVIAALLVLPLHSLLGQKVVAYENPRESTSAQPNFNSPNAYAFAEYVVNPVGYYTGIPQISIPIHTVELKDFSLPLALTYHAGGIKVEESASNVGLGWTLAAGGVITRSVKDRADDTSVEFCDNQWFKAGPSYGLIGRPTPCGNGLLWANAEPATANYTGPGNYDINLDAYNGLPNTAGYSMNLLKKFYDVREKAWDDYTDAYLLPMADKEPDIFYFNFAGRTGQFVFDVSGATPKIRMMPYQDLQIDFTIDARKKLSSFTITDEKGVIYTFAAIEKSRNQYDCNTGAVDGDEAVQRGFAYDWHVRNYETGSGTTEYTSSWYLSRIETPLGDYLDFSYANEIYTVASRGPQQTATYNIWDRVLTYDPNDFTIAPREFDYWKKGYLNLLSYSNLVVYGKRLTRIENNNIRIQFDAPMEREDVATPTSDATGAFAISEITITNKIGGENRIKKVKLTQDYFTSNLTEYINKPGILFTSYHRINVPDSLHAYKRLRLRSVQEFGKDDTAFDPPYELTYHYFDYTGNNNHKLPHRFSFQQDIWGYYNGAYNNNTLIPTQYIYPDHYPVKDSRQFRVYKKSNYTGREIELKGAYRIPSSTHADIGMLTRITYPTKGYTEYQYELHSFRNEQEDYKGGGLRISGIKKSDGFNQSLDMIYAYGYSNDDQTSSGCIVTMPVCAARIWPMARFSDSGDSEMAYRRNVVRYSMPQVALGSTNGSYVGYRTVSEQKLSGGTTIYTFSMPAAWHVENDIPITTPGGFCDPAIDGHCDGLYSLTAVKDIFVASTAAELSASNYDLSQNPALPNTYPFPDNPEYDWQRGHLLSERQYTSAGVPVQENRYTYANYLPDNRTLPSKVYGYKFVNHFLSLKATNSMPAGYTFRAAKYTLLTDIGKVLKSKKEIIYNAADITQSLTSELTFTYENKRFQGATLITSKDSQGREIKTIRKFPGDLTGNELGSDLLIPKHIHDAPLRQLTMIDGVTTARKEAAYLSSQGKLVPGTITSFLDGDSSPNRALLAYDDGGNLIQSVGLYSETPNGVTKFTGNPMSYLWGYNKTLAIARIENAKTTDVFYTGFEDAEGNSLVNDARTGRKSRTGGYTKTLSNLSNGNYTLSYWKKSGSAWGLQQQQVAVTQGTYTISIPATDQLDDVRFFPVSARVSSYTYDPLVGMTSATDPNNLTTYYEFDLMNRLKYVRDTNKKIVKQHMYHFKGQP